MPKIVDFRPFIGQHCETMATGNLLQHAGLPISEPMLFGLGEGLGFGVFSLKSMPAPFIGGRAKFERVTRNAAANLGFEVEYRQTRSRKKAWENVASFIEAGRPVAVKLDCYFLDYFNTDIHFAAHYVAVHGYDDDLIYVVDTDQQGGNLSTSRQRFEEGRLWKGPMASNALTWTVTAPLGGIDWPACIRKAIRANSTDYLNPPIRNFGADGIRKAAALAPGWAHTIENAPVELAQMGLLMERAGTGGGLFRRMYRDFLVEANALLKSAAVDEAAELIGESGKNWTQAAELLMQFAGDPAALDHVAALWTINADLEEKAFGLLVDL